MEKIKYLVELHVKTATAADTSHLDISITNDLKNADDVNMLRNVRKTFNECELEFFSLID